MSYVRLPLKIATLFLLSLLLTPFCKELEAHEAVHDHTSLHGGQVGMSGNFHIEFLMQHPQKYIGYITDFSRKPVDISNAKGSITINPDGPGREELPITVDKPLLGEFSAEGRPRKEGDSIYASVRIELPGKDAIFADFQTF